MKAALHLFLLLAVLPVPAGADDASEAPATEFARISRAADGVPDALQLAIVTYAPPDGAYSVDLVSAIHIGDREYYHGLNERFRDYDALLYELIVPDDDQPERHAAATGVLSKTQIGMKNVLGLSFQLEEIDYGAPNFVHADMTSEMLAQSMADRGESLYVYFWRLIFASIDDYARDPLGLKEWQFLASALDSRRGNGLKIAMAREMVEASSGKDVLGGEDGSAIIAARNAHALEVLRQELAAGSRHVGIFYGVAHMPDFEERLADELVLRKVAIEWIDAWRFARVESQPDSESDSESDS